MCAIFRFCEYLVLDLSIAGSDGRGLAALSILVVGLVPVLVVIVSD